jgi:hypothetical protein
MFFTAELAESAESLFYFLLSAEGGKQKSASLQGLSLRL